MKRREFLRRVPVFAATTLAACGGGGQEDAGGAATASPPAPGLSPTPNPPTPNPSLPPSPNAPYVTGIPTFSLIASQAGTFPYTAAVFPLRGEVPSGTTLVSADDPTLDSSVLSTWPDGSVAVLVLAGEVTLAAGTSKQIRLQSGTVTRKALSASRVGELISRIAVDCGSLGSAVIADFSMP